MSSFDTPSVGDATTTTNPSAARGVVRVVTDSSCDLPASLAAELGIGVVPLTIRIDGVEYTDRVDLTPAEFWARCNTSPTLPETAAPSPGLFAQEFRRMAEQGAQAIVVVTLSGEMSGTLQSAQVGARVLADSGGPPVEVIVVDSRSVSMGLGMVAVHAARMAASGAGVHDVADSARSRAQHTRVWAALDTLDNLKKGGRIGGAKAMLASALAIKPIIEVRHGRVEQGGKQRSRARALAFLVETLRRATDAGDLAVLHADCTDVDQFVEQLRPHYDGPMVIGDIGPVVGAHTGRGTIGIAFTEHAAPSAAPV